MAVAIFVLLKEVAGARHLISMEYTIRVRKLTRASSSNSKFLANKRIQTTNSAEKNECL